MSIKASVFIATSLAGFIARENGDLDWLTGAESASTEQDFGYQAFIDAADTVVMGRNTFELASTFDAWPYGGKRVVVLSSRPSAVPPRLADAVEWLSMPPRRLVARLEAQDAKRIYVDGGKTIQGFLNAGLIDELTITRIPVLIGTGVPLFGPLDHDVGRVEGKIEDLAIVAVVVAQGLPVPEPRFPFRPNPAPVGIASASQRGLPRTLNAHTSSAFTLPNRTRGESRRADSNR